MEELGCGSLGSAGALDQIQLSPSLAACVALGVTALSSSVCPLGSGCCRDCGVLEQGKKCFGPDPQCCAHESQGDCRAPQTKRG